MFELQPQVHETTVDTQILPQLTNVVQTQSEVNTSSTLIKLEMKTVPSLPDEHIVVISGLAEDKEIAGHNALSFPPAQFHTRSNELICLSSKPL